MRGADRFQTTHWSLVASAGQGQGNGREALAQLCETYWLPLYAYAARRLPDPANAQDATQAFFAELLEKEVLAAADPERGRFRAFLLTAFKNFLHRMWQREAAGKRGGGKLPISLDFAGAGSSVTLDPPGGLTPEQIYDRQWTIALLGQVMQRQQEEMQAAGKEQHFQVLKSYLVGDQAGGYTEAAAALEMTEAAVRQAVSRMRKRYGVLLREEIAKTVNSPEEVDAEIRSLFSTLRN